MLKNEEHKKFFDDRLTGLASQFMQPLQEARKITGESFFYYSELNGVERIGVYALARRIINLWINFVSEDFDVTKLRLDLLPPNKRINEFLAIIKSEVRIEPKIVILAFRLWSQNLRRQNKVLPKAFIDLLPYF